MRYKKIGLIIITGLAASHYLLAQHTWIKTATPVLSRSAAFPGWKGLATGDAMVLSDNDTLKMWYAGVGWISGAEICPRVRIGYAWSLDGIKWNEFAGNPVLDVSTDTLKFDSDGIETPAVIKDAAAPAQQRYKMWYAGRKLKCLPVNDHKIGYATSPDGINWTKHSGDAVLTTGSDTSWFNSYVSGPSVLLDSGTYKMWFTAPDLILNGQPTDGKGNIGYATSLNGINWTVHPSPVLIAGSQLNWDAASIAEPSVIKTGGTYHMFYAALDKWAIENFQVGYAYSVNGVTWQKSNNNPVLKIGNTGGWDHYWATHPGVVYDSNTNKFKMWYTGRNTENITGLNGHFWDIGYAQSNYALGRPTPNNRLKIFPNPVQNQIHIQVEMAQSSEVNIYNLIGQNLSCPFSIINNFITINTSTLSNGNYYIIIRNKGRQLYGYFLVIK